MLTAYSFSITSNFPNQKIDGTKFLFEIRSSTIVTALDRVDINEETSVVAVWMKDELSETDELILQGIVTLHDGQPLEPESQKVEIISNLDADKNIKITTQPVVGSTKNFITHNFCDPCSWYQASIAVAEKTISPKVSEVYDVYSMGDVNIIDIYHGRLSLENTISSRSTYKPVVKVNDVVKTEDTDFTINYVLGEITFMTPLTGSDVVKTSYKKAGDSTFTLSSIAGKKLKIVHAEIQFSKNLAVAATPIYFDAYVYNPYDLPNKVLYKRNEYNNAKDYLNEANIGYVIPGFGELTEEILILPWNYPAAKTLKYSEGAEVRISTKNHQPIKTLSNERGQVGTCTFYCLSEDE